MVTVQYEPFPMLGPQLDAVLTKGAETVSEVSVTTPEVVFLIVTTWVAEVAPTLTVPKESEVGDSARVDAVPVPVPVSAMELGEPVPLLTTTSVPFEVPVAVGL
jgi:hypothetical protein